MGSPASLDRATHSELARANALTSEPLRIDEGSTRFDLECPGVALVETEI